VSGGNGWVDVDSGSQNNSPKPRYFGGFMYCCLFLCSIQTHSHTDTPLVHQRMSMLRCLGGGGVFELCYDSAMMVL
jgi:hypothetical protein